MITAKFFEPVLTMSGKSTLPLAVCSILALQQVPAFGEQTAPESSVKAVTQAVAPNGSATIQLPTQSLIDSARPSAPPQQTRTRAASTGNSAARTLPAPIGPIQFPQLQSVNKNNSSTSVLASVMPSNVKLIATPSVQMDGANVSSSTVSAQANATTLLPGQQVQPLYLTRTHPILLQQRQAKQQLPRDFTEKSHLHLQPMFRRLQVVLPPQLQEHQWTAVPITAPPD